ncbi:hypothetical protein P7C73_g2523, partial [Tremellales sp. Uapishka_1]
MSIAKAMHPNGITPFHDSIPDPIPDPDPARCRLLGPTALIVQASMGLFVILSLIIKRQLEKRKRPWRIWLWDVGKQLVGQMVIHGLNLLISSLVAHAADNNPCSLYFLNVLIDTTIGVAIFYFALKGFTWLFSMYLEWEGLISGQYGNPPQSRFWWAQLVPYLLSSILMKALVVLPLTLPFISSLLLSFSHDLLDFLSPRIQVIFVMAVFPLIMTVFQFCIVDQVIKSSISEDMSPYGRLPTEDDVESRRHAIPSSPIIPSSPLLLPTPGIENKDYGSTSPARLQPDAFWRRLSRGRDEDVDESSSTDGGLNLRLDRSSAPSPDSNPPFSATSRLSEEAGQEARKTLSPTARAVGTMSPQGEETRLDEM